MRKVNINEIAEATVSSPKGKFHLFRRHISLALGGKKDAGIWGGGHPFDLELTRVPAGAVNWPYHAHSAQWELFVVVTGHGIVCTPDGETKIGAGDCFIHSPGEPHHIRNTGNDDLVFYIVADNPPADAINYPESSKWFIKPERKTFEMVEVDYYKGEE